MVSSGVPSGVSSGVPSGVSSGVSLGGRDVGSQQLNWYTCGPTVYDDAHLGHARTYVTVDVIQRVLSSYFGIGVNHVMNVTDVDDKIIAKARDARTDPRDLARRFEERFMADMADLGCAPPTVLRVTDNMGAIVDAANAIAERGFAYIADDGLYMDTEALAASGVRYPSFGTGAQAAEHGQGGKKCAADFALWKSAKTGEPRWDSPWGPGRPGWHIECTALAQLGCRGTVHVHAGGEDLRFPHHANEVAQAQALGCRDPWVRHWVHVGHLSISGLKMSKSLKNFVTVRDALSEHTARQLRLAFAAHPWWEPMSWGDRMDEAVAKERVFESFLARSRDPVAGAARPPTAASDRFANELRGARQDVHAALSKNVDTAAAIDRLLGLVKAGNAYARDPDADPTLVKAAAAFVEGVLFAMGLDFSASHERCAGAFRSLYSDVRAMAKDLFAACDAARAEMTKAGLVL